MDSLAEEQHTLAETPPPEHAGLSPSSTEEAVAAEATPASHRPSAKEVAEQVLSWANGHHLLDPAVIPAQGVFPEGPTDGTLFPDQSGSNTLHVLRTKQVAGVVYSESEKTVSILTRRKLPDRAVKSMPSYHSGLTVRYLYFGNAQAGTQAQSADGPSYREVNGRYSCGSSIHPARYPGAGTLGCLLRDAQGQLYGLSANHVSGLANYSDEGEKILAPGHSDITPAGCDPFTIGVHIRALPMIQGSPTNVNISDNTDAAVFLIRDPEKVSSSQGGYYDTPTSVRDPEGGMLVEKVGRTTGHSMGRVVGISPSPFAVGYQLSAVSGNATVYFNNLVMVFGENGSLFSMPGDSGSLIVGMEPDGSRHAVGILIAGTGTGFSLILPLQPILQALSMDLVSDHHA